MTNTTFPVFSMDNIRLWSHGKETPDPSQRIFLSENWLSQCSSFLFCLFVRIKINQSYFWDMLFKTSADNHQDFWTRSASINGSTFLNVMN